MAETRPSDASLVMGGEVQREQVQSKPQERTMAALLSSWDWRGSMSVFQSVEVPSQYRDTYK